LGSNARSSAMVSVTGCGVIAVLSITRLISATLAND
jgi:hypothetical protein